MRRYEPCQPDVRIRIYGSRLDPVDEENLDDDLYSVDISNHFNYIRRISRERWQDMQDKYKARVIE